MDQKELARRADDIFERRIRPSLEADAQSRFVAIDVDSEDFEVDDRDLLAMRRLRSRHPQARIWLRKTDSPYARVFGSALVPKRTETRDRQFDGSII
jgi:hypothetical protein